MLKQGDLEGTVPFADAVCIGGWPLDDHPPGGFDRVNLPPNTSIRTKEVYHIPLRSLYSKNVSNLMMAGRNISASHVAFTSSRVMATCAVEGQAVGLAASLCAKHGLTPRALASDASRVKQLQQMLLRDDQTITGITNQDPADVARRAKVAASSELDEAPARNLLDGEVRDIPNGARHQWAAKMQPGGVWVDYAWDGPQAISHIQLTFDSGFQRELTLTSLNRANESIIRAPQPETVRDYRILYRESSGGEWKPLVERKGNHQRLVRHNFNPVRAQALRLHVDATNGDELARVFELRCYA
jgi:hypothetical protein